MSSGSRNGSACDCSIVRRAEISLTEAGAAYYRHCARIVAEAESAEQAARALQPPKIETKNSTLFFNPGSAGPRRFRLPITVGRMTAEHGKLRAEIVELSVER